MKNIAKAITEVMKEIQSVEKNTDVGFGKSSYKGVQDKDVKQIVRTSFIKNGLSILPIDYATDVKVERWEESYNGNTKTKQSVFVEVNAKYLLLHESGESIQVAGLGHGVDSQDKAAGKATTYSLKNALLYIGLIPTGSIDDADMTHSNEYAVPQNAPATPPPPPKKPALTPQAPKGKDGKPVWDSVVQFLAGKTEHKPDWNKVKAKYSITETNQSKLVRAVDELTQEGA